MKTILFLFPALSAILQFISISAAGSSIGLPADFPDLAATQSGDTAPGVFIGWLGFWAVDYYVVLDQSGYPLFYSKTEQMSYPGVMFYGLMSAPAP